MFSFLMFTQIRQGDGAESKQRRNRGRVENLGCLGPTDCGRFFLSVWILLVRLIENLEPLLGWI